MCIRDRYRLGDYIVINLSSPNTPGLRDNLKSQNFEKIVTNIHRLRDENNSKIPILFKISPDISDQDKKDISLISLANDVDGLILTNTTINKSMVNEKLEGGVSGRPLFLKSNELIRDFYTLTSGKIKIIGVGGVDSGISAYKKFLAGADYVQLYTGMVYKGPGIVKEIKKDLISILKKENLKNVSEAVGINA